MALWDWVLVGVAGLSLRACAERQDDDNEKTEAWLQDIERKRAVNKKRKNTPCRFRDGLTQGDFDRLARSEARRIQRIKSVRTENAVVYGTVESQSGLTEWEFSVDFNNWGHVTGTYWTTAENEDSSIPKHYGSNLSSAIGSFLRERYIYLEDFSDFVDANKTLETSTGLDTQYRESFFQRLFKKGYRTVKVGNSLEHYCGEHLYPVVSLLKKRGFVNIKCCAMEDIDNKSDKYVYEVEKISIAGMTKVDYDYPFQHNVEVIIYYHSKRRILMPVSAKKLRKRNYIEVGDYLQELGFSEIFERKINDVILGVVKKVGAVEDVLVDNGDETPIAQGSTYFYDEKIIITYHVRKNS
jgi:hypothetical protein